MIIRSSIWYTNYLIYRYIQYSPIYTQWKLFYNYTECSKKKTIFELKGSAPNMHPTTNGFKKKKL